MFTSCVYKTNVSFLLVYQSKSADLRYLIHPVIPYSVQYIVANNEEIPNDAGFNVGIGFGISEFRSTFCHGRSLDQLSYLCLKKGRTINATLSFSEDMKGKNILDIHVEVDILQ